MKKKIFYEVILLTSSVAFSIVLLETASFYFNQFKYSLGPTNYKKEYIKTMSDSVVNSEDYPNFPNLPQYQDDTDRFIRHPYAGRVYIDSPRKIFPYYYDQQLLNQKLDSLWSKSLKDNEELRIGVFGGSVAEGLFYFFEGSQSEQRLRREVSWLKNKKIRFFNFAIPGAKKAQQFGFFHLNLDQLHVTIDLDGFNDIDLDAGAQFPTHWPHQSEFHFPRKNAPQDPQFQRLYYLAKLRKLMAYFSFQYSWFGERNFYFALWKSLDLSLARLMHDSFMQFTYADSGNGANRNQDSFQLQLKTEQAESWRKFTHLQHLLAKKNHLISLTYLQPNQYVYGSKLTFTESEKKIALYRDENYEKWLNHGYKKLQEKVRQLKSSGWPVYDLSMIFRKTTEEIYIDSCCHINIEGYKIIGGTILNDLIKILNSHGEQRVLRSKKL